MTDEIPASKHPAEQKNKLPLAAFWQKKRQLVVCMVVAFLALLSILSFTLQPTHEQKSASPQQPTTDPLANWKVYRNQLLQFKYPDNWDVASESGSVITLGQKAKSDLAKAQNGYEIFLTISWDAASFVPYKSLLLCSQISEQNPQMCIEENGYNQKEPISQISLHGNNAVSFYVGGFIDYANHVVQIPQPAVELKMNVAGGGLDATFEKILSSFQFSNQDLTTDATGQLCGGPVLTPCPSGSLCKITTVKSGNVTEESGRCVRTSLTPLVSDGSPYQNSSFTITVPKSWTMNASPNSYLFSSGEKRLELIISNADSFSSDEKDVLDNQIKDQTKMTRTLTLGSAQGAEYYGCVGIEGCANMYITVVQRGKETWYIEYYDYGDEKGVYQSIISSMRFK